MKKRSLVFWLKKNDEILQSYNFGDYFINHDISGSRKIKQPGFKWKVSGRFFVFFLGKRCLEQNVANLYRFSDISDRTCHALRETGGFKTKESF